ncbi:MAG: DMT family transporter [Flavobacteriaceae bacterium]
MSGRDGAAGATALKRRIATLTGLSAVVMWSSLAILSVLSGPIPPFQLTAMCFALAGTVGLLRLLLSPSAARTVLRVPLAGWALGIGGLFLFHAFYFAAVQNAPPVDASLISYLWPLLIVVFSAFLPGERLAAGHVAGALLGLGGAALVIAGRGGPAFDPRYAAGYLAALGAALTWSSYSVLSRRFSAVPTDAVTGFCLATAALSLACHLAFETTVWPVSAGQWAAVAALGAFPVGLAFFTWDHGVKHGDIQFLGVAAYAAPLFSTLFLVAAGLAAPSWHIAAACLLISGGGLLAALAGRRP